MKHYIFPNLKIPFIVSLCFLYIISLSEEVLPRDLKVSLLTQIEQKPKTREEKLQNTILWINHMNLIVTKILTYNDKLVLSLEYEKLMDSTNFNNLPEGNLKTSILKLIDTLKCLDNSWTEKKRVKELFKKNMDAAFWKSIRQGGKAAINIARDGTKIAVACKTGNINVENFIYEAVNSVADLLTTPLDYYDIKDSLREHFDIKTFEIAQNDKELIHNLRNQIWKLFSEEFSTNHIQDQERISIKDCRELMSILKNNSLREQYIILSGTNNQKRFIKFPFYWYQLGHTAYSQGKFQESAKAFSHFQTIYRSLIRNDELFINYLISKIQLLLKITPSDQRELIETLSILEEVILNQDWKTRYYIALVHMKLNNFQKAESLISHNIAFLTSQIKENSTSKYRDILGEKNIPLIECPNNETLAYNRNILTEIKLKKGISFDDCIKDILKQFAVSSHEKLQYFGMVSNERILISLKKDIKGIMGKSVYNEFDPYFNITIPSVWFYTENTPYITLTCFDSNHNIIKKLDVFSGKWDKKNHQMVLTIPFDADYTLFKTICEVSLKINHKIYPITINYQITPPIKENIKKISNFKKLKKWAYQKLKIQQTETLFIPKSMIFQNKEYSLDVE